ncbi:MAG: methyltransferase domain-containing protein [Proteobacteria bacterium]|nr:methyltransferase domain-containing protein [Pseudomonadota bacterium]
MDYTTGATAHAAEAIVKLLMDALPIASVLDVGCARGTWLSAWAKAGVKEVQGVDGDYIAIDTLQIPPDCFLPSNLGNTLNLARRFDLVQSLEVAEHIPSQAADQFVENLVTHANDLILFSAAPPGQGGEFHVNEQPYEYWRARFQAQGFEPCDVIRPRIAKDTSIPFWYRYNILLYVRRERFDTLPETFRQSRVPGDAQIHDLTPAWFRLRKHVVRLLPFAVQQSLARLKARRSRSA